MSALQDREETAGDAPFVRSLDRGLGVLRAFDAAHPRLSLSEAARITGLSRATARRFLHTLAELGYVRTDGSAFWLTPRVLELGHSYLSGLELPEVARPHLEQLVDRLAEPAAVAVLDGDAIVFVERAKSGRVLAPAHTVGARWPAFATPAGRVLLAALPEPERAARLAGAELSPLTERTLTDPGALLADLERVAADGFSLVDQELEDGLRSVAAPLRNASGSVSAAITVALVAGRWSVDRVLHDVVPVLLGAAARIEEDLRRVG